MENKKAHQLVWAVQSAMTVIPDRPLYVMLAISLVPEMFMNSQLLPYIYTYVRIKPNNNTTVAIWVMSRWRKVHLSPISGSRSKNV